MMGVDKTLIPQEILKDSALVHLAQAYFSVTKQLEKKTKCSQTRGFIMAALRGGVSLNQNQIATMLGFDRTVVHRAIRTMIEEGLLSERKAETGRALLIQLTPKGNKYRESLIKERRAAEEKLREQLTSGEATTLIQLLKRIAELEF
jgi:DNA-binding MarR family transcriptional regulator